MLFLREKPIRKPFYHEKNGAAGPEPQPNYVIARRGFAQIVEKFNSAGYLDKAFGRDCVDGHRPDPSPVLENILYGHSISLDSGDAPLWPLSPEDWTDPIFFSLVEVFYELVARPRIVENFHDFNDCGAHYAQFAAIPGRELYAARINQLLARAQLPLQLATHGEDTGRLVASSDDARNELVERSLGTNDAWADDVAHAIGLFRGRNATRLEKRSAVVTLVGLLERERKLLKSELQKDENDLFNIANNFSLRHNTEKQHANYGDEFLDWIFWWYLATVELIRSLRQRAATSAESAESAEKIINKQDGT